MQTVVSRSSLLPSGIKIIHNVVSSSLSSPRHAGAAAMGDKNSMGDNYCRYAYAQHFLFRAWEGAFPDFNVPIGTSFQAPREDDGAGHSFQAPREDDGDFQNGSQEVLYGRVTFSSNRPSYYPVFVCPSS